VGNHIDKWLRRVETLRHKPGSGAQLCCREPAIPTVWRQHIRPTSIHQMTVTPYLRNTRSADTTASWS
jgi:hypothetical protein